MGFAQWSVTNGITVGRNDDIFFVSDSVGYVAGGNRDQISRTTDGGNSWVDIFQTAEYVRSIEFFDASTGFAGTLDSGLYVTRDSGRTWLNIAGNISPRPEGICGLSIPNDSTIYGCGFFNEPAFIIKSTDRGLSWTYIDMSAYAKALVEVHFIDADTGFVAGRANPFSDGGVILKTTDGGITWTPVMKTMDAFDYVWKIQSPDGKHFFGGVSSVPATGQTSFVKSTDAGQTWSKFSVDTAWSDIQMIGFTDSLNGWTGGQLDLFETHDGGVSWNKNNSLIPSGGYYNRFLIKDDSTAFITGLRIYMYDKNNISTFVEETNVKEGEIHQLLVNPNPTNDVVHASLLLGTNTALSILLLNSEGKLLEKLYHGRLSKGRYEFESAVDYEPQILFLVVRTNEGILTQKVITQ